jgi:hypothetical protein
MMPNPADYTLKSQPPAAPQYIPPPALPSYAPTPPPQTHCIGVVPVNAPGLATTCP